MSNFKTLIFSEDEMEGKSMLSFRNDSETQLLTTLESLQSVILESPANSLHLFQAYIINHSTLNLKLCAQIYKLLQANGFIKLRFKEITSETFNKVTNMLKANGFANKDPMGGAISNEILYAKPEMHSSAIKINNSEGKILSANVSEKKEAFGQFNYNKLIQVDPNQQNDFLDEDELLKGETNYVPFEQKDDSCVTKPKACKNCSCGRKAQEFNFLISSK